MKRLFPVIAAALLLAGIGCSSFGNKPPAPAPSTETVSALFGAVETYKADTRVLAVRTPDGGLEDVKLPASITDGAASVGTLVKVDGTRELSTRVIDATSLTEVPSGNLVVTSPTSGATVTSPLVVFGFGRVFEQQFAWQLKDSTGAVAASGHGQTHAPDAGMYGPFRLDLILPAFKDKAFTLEVFDRSAKDGSVQDLVSVPLQLLTTDVTTVQVFFSNAAKGSAKDCEAVFPVSRTFAKTSTVGRAALEALLQGPTPDEIHHGYFTSINAGTELNSLSIDPEGTATADFSSSLNAAGSCRVSAIRSQISKTLEQFPTIGDVRITVDGDERTALQP
jgi:hypothetical protein